MRYQVDGLREQLRRLSVYAIGVCGADCLVEVSALLFRLVEDLPQRRLVGDPDGLLPDVRAASRMNVDGGIPKEEERAMMAARSSSVMRTLMCAVLALPRMV